MFRKNSIVPYYILYYSYMIYVLKSYDHMSFWNILQLPELVT